MYLYVSIYACLYHMYLCIKWKTCTDTFFLGKEWEGFQCFHAVTSGPNRRLSRHLISNCPLESTAVPSPWITMEPAWLWRKCLLANMRLELSRLCDSGDVSLPPVSIIGHDQTPSPPRPPQGDMLRSSPCKAPGWCCWPLRSWSPWPFSPAGWQLENAMPSGNGLMIRFYQYVIYSIYRFRYIDIENNGNGHMFPLPLSYGHVRRRLHLKNKTLFGSKPVQHKHCNSLYEEWWGSILDVSNILQPETWCLDYLIHVAQRKLLSKPRIQNASADSVELPLIAATLNRKRHPVHRYLVICFLEALQRTMRTCHCHILWELGHSNEKVGLGVQFWLNSSCLATEKSTSSRLNPGNWEKNPNINVI